MTKLSKEELETRLKTLGTSHPAARDVVNHIAAMECENARLRWALQSAQHDLETSEGLYACDNEQGHSLFRLDHPSIKAVNAALEGKEKVG